MGRVSGGRATYGHVVGVLMFAGGTPRIPGDLGHAATLGSGVLYEVLDDVSFRDLVNGSDAACDALIAGALRLQSAGVEVITGDCGLLARYQREIGVALDVPFVSSSLLLVPLVWRLQGCVGAVGVITGHSGMLAAGHLVPAGIGDDIDVHIAGLQETPEFREVVMNGRSTLDPDAMRDQVVDVAKAMLVERPDLRSIVLECTNLPSYTRDIRRAVQLPVYDVLALVDVVRHATHPPVWTWNNDPG